MRPIHILALLTLGAACAVTERPPQSDTAVQQQLTDRVAALRTALLAGNPDSFLAFWTNDVRVLEPGVDRTGEAFRTYVREFFANGKVTALEIQTFDRFVHGEVAYETGQYDETAQVQGQPPMTFRYFYFSRWERGADGQWRIDRFVAGPRDAPPGM